MHTLEGVMKISPCMIMSTSQLLYRRNGPLRAFSIHSSSCTVEGRDESQGDLTEIKRSEDRTLRDVHWTCGLTELSDTNTHEGNATMFNLRWETWDWKLLKNHRIRIKGLMHIISVISAGLGRHSLAAWPLYPTAPRSVVWSSRFGECTGRDAPVRLWPALQHIKDLKALSFQATFYPWTPRCFF